MWTRALLKQNAKLALKNFYWMGFLATLVVMVITGFATSSVSQLVTGTTMIGFGSSFEMMDDSIEAVIAAFIVMLFAFIIAMVVSYAVSFFLAYPLNIGLNRFFLESRSFKSKLERIFCVFSSGKQNYLAVVKTMFFYGLRVFLWSLLFVIPGIVKSYEYRMIPYILAENPTLPMERVFELSRRMTDGEKMKMFVLDLSFMGWYLLGSLAFGVGVLFVYPYVYATWAEFYTAMREKAFGMHFSDTNELFGIHPIG